MTSVATHPDNGFARGLRMARGISMGLMFVLMIGIAAGVMPFWSTTSVALILMFGIMLVVPHAIHGISEVIIDYIPNESDQKVLLWGLEMVGIFWAFFRFQSSEYLLLLVDLAVDAIPAL